MNTSSRKLLIAFSLLCFLETSRIEAFTWPSLGVLRRCEPLKILTKNIFAKKIIGVSVGIIMVACIAKWWRSTSISDLQDVNRYLENIQRRLTELEKLESLEPRHRNELRTFHDNLRSISKRCSTDICDEIGNGFKNTPPPQGMVLDQDTDNVFDIHHFLQIPRTASWHQLRRAMEEMVHIDQDHVQYIERLCPNEFEWENYRAYMNGPAAVWILPSPNSNLCENLIDRTRQLINQD